jgi:septum formation protein
VDGQRTGTGIVLASASPRRRALLEGVGLPIRVHAVDVDESPREGEPARDLAVRLAVAKAEAVAARFPGRPVLGADTVVVTDGKALGKPGSVDEARSMLRLLSGRWHEVVTGVALVLPGGTTLVDHAVTRVRFASLEAWEIDAYAAGAEPHDKAGAYALQGAAGWFIEEVRGSVSNVVGLPLEKVRALFRAAGLDGPSLDPGGTADPGETGGRG